jgi:hypothetical protein
MEGDAAALDAILAVRPVWRSLVPAREAVGLEPTTLLHAGPAFASPAEITRPVLNSAVVAAVFEGLAADFEAAEAMIRAGEIALAPAQDLAVVTPLAAVVSSSMLLHVVADAAGSDAGGAAPAAYAPINGGSGPAMRLGLRSEAVLEHIRWLNGPMAEVFDRALTGEIDLIELAAHGLTQGDDGHGRTPAATAELSDRLSPAMGDDASAEAARRFLAEGPSFFLNLWMAGCKCILGAAAGIPGASLVVTAGANGTETGIQVAGLPGRWFTARARPPHGDLGGQPANRALGAIGDSAIVDALGFGAMAMAYAPEQRFLLQPFMPAGGLSLPGVLLRRVHPGFGELDLRVGLCARRVVASGRRPAVSLGILDAEGTAGRLGGGIFEVPAALFEAAVAALDRQT